MPAERYCWRSTVLPERARSKSLEARARASGGSWEADGGEAASVVGCWEGCGCCGRPMVLVCRCMAFLARM